MLERSWEAEAVVPGSQEAVHLGASQQAHLSLKARRQTRNLHSQVQEEVVAEGVLRLI